MKQYFLRVIVVLLLTCAVVNAQQPVGPGSGGASGERDPEYATIEDLPRPCTSNARARVTQPNAAIEAEQWCNAGGEWETIGGSGGTPTPTTRGVVTDAVNLLAEHPALTSVTQSRALNLDHTVCVTSGTTATLPPLATAEGLVFYLMICDAGSDPFSLVASGSELMNGSVAAQQMSGQWSLMEVRGFGTTGWSVKTPITLSELLGSTTVTIRYALSGARPSSANPAEVNNAEVNTRILFDASTSECVDFQDVVPADYGSNLTARIIFSAVSATSGTAHFDVQVMAVTPGDSADVVTESFATANDCNDGGVPGTAGYADVVTCALTNADSLAAYDFVKWRICRDIGDSATGDLEVLGFAITYTRQ